MIATGWRLYITTPERLDLHNFSDLLARALDAGEVAAVQLRLKNAAADVWKDAIDALRPICQSRRVAFLRNDRGDLERDRRRRDVGHCRRLDRRPH